MAKPGDMETKEDPKPTTTGALRPTVIEEPERITVLMSAAPGDPKMALSWWLREPGEKMAWKAIPDEALQRFDDRGCMVRLYPAKFNVAREIERVGVAATEGPAAPPASEHGVRCDIVRPIPAQPFVLEGTGSGGPSTSRTEISLTRTRVPNTKDEILWVVIRKSASSLAFDEYERFMDGVFSNRRIAEIALREKVLIGNLVDPKIETFSLSSVDAYRILKAATELFVMTHCGVVPPKVLKLDSVEEEARFGHGLRGDFEVLWQDYLAEVGNPAAPHARILPYLDLIRRKLGDVSTVRTSAASLVDRQTGLLREKLVHPPLLELIWSYWMEEGMLVQTFNSIIRRFQNRGANGGERDPLAQLELDPLRPLNNLLWGWVQDEQSLLSVLRRAHEYDHHYGFTLHGKALAELRAQDRRSKFLEAFHNLLWKCIQFYRQDDDTTVIADGFPVLNALKETHYLLAQGAHNQFGDLPSTARQEMLMQQWLLSRPEIRDFLGGRVMVPYVEPWMDRVDAVKTLKGWTDTSVVHFRDLAYFGEQILLTVRWGAWSTINDPNSASNWARYWRPEVQGYVHAYRAATGVDLTADVTDARQAEARFLPPSVHLRQRLLPGGR